MQMVNFVSSGEEMTNGSNLVDCFQRVVGIHPEKTAMHCGDSSFTFRELDDRVSRLASALVGKGVAFGDRIAVLSRNCHGFAELYWAAAHIGVAIVPLDARLAEEEMRFIVDQVQPKAVVGDTQDRTRLLSRLSSSCIFAVSMEGGSTEGSLIDYQELVTGDRRDLATIAICQDTPVAIFYTAAVDGKPKGAVVTHGNLVCQAVQTANRVGLTPDDSHGVFLPLSHTFGAFLMFVAACNGVCNTMLSTFDAQVAVDLISQGRVSFFAEFAPMAERIWQAADQSGMTFGGKLRFVMGLDLPPTIEKYLEAGVRFWCLYGQTETAGLVTMGEVFRSKVAANYSGTPLELTNISLRGEDGKVVEAGGAGEAWIHSDCVVRRYWPDTPTRLSEDGWLQTGDILRAEAGEEFYFVGRTSDKDLIKPGGLNVYPAEVEQVLSQHEMVRAAYVFGVPDPIWRECVCAVVVPKEAGHGQLHGELLARCEKGLASYKRPAALVVAEDLAHESTMPTRQEMKARYFPTPPENADEKG